MSRAQDCFATCTWYTDTSTYILWSLIAQMSLESRKKFRKKILSESLTDFRTPLKNPSVITPAWITDVRVDGSVVVCRDVMNLALCKMGPRRDGQIDL